ncbi:hypothetical protein V8C42DRAFT_140516 [Trichoderma barbatum]
MVGAPGSRDMTWIYSRSSVPSPRQCTACTVLAVVSSCLTGVQGANESEQLGQSKELVKTRERKVSSKTMRSTIVYHVLGFSPPFAPGMYTEYTYPHQERVRVSERGKKTPGNPPMATWQQRVGLSWGINLSDRPGVGRGRAGPIVVPILRRPPDLAVELWRFSPRVGPFLRSHDQNTEKVAGQASDPVPAVVAPCRRSAAFSYRVCGVTLAVWMALAQPKLL